jgi:hypothetical protein
MYGMSYNMDTKDYILVFNSEYLTRYYEEYCVKCGKIYTDVQYRWCKVCQLKYLKENFSKWTSGNEKIDNFIQEMQLKVIEPNDIIFEWIPYNQFDKIKEINKSDLYSAVWKNGPLHYDYQNKKWTRVLDKEVTLRYLDSPKNINDKFLDKV